MFSTPPEVLLSFDAGGASLVALPDDPSSHLSAFWNRCLSWKRGNNGWKLLQECRIVWFQPLVVWVCLGSTNNLKMELVVVEHNC